MSTIKRIVGSIQIMVKQILIHICLSPNVYVCTYVSMYVCMYVCKYVCMYTYIIQQILYNKYIV